MRTPWVVWSSLCLAVVAIAVSAATGEPRGSFGGPGNGDVLGQPAHDSMARAMRAARAPLLPPAAEPNRWRH
jgi:hypothetical protein